MAPSDSPEDYTLVNLFRVLIATIVVALSFLVAAEGRVILVPASAVAWAASVAWLVLERLHLISTVRTPRIAYLPTTFDVSAVTFFVVFTGTTSSLLVVGYYYIILVSSMNVHSRQGEVATGLSLAAFVGAAAAVHLGWLPRVNVLGLEPMAGPFPTALSVVGNGILFVAVNRLVRNHSRQTAGLIAQLEQKEADLNQQKATVQLLLHDYEAQASDWLMQLDGEGRITYVADRMENRTPGGLRGRLLSEVLLNRVPDDDEEDRRLVDGLMEALGSGRPFRGLQVRLVVEGTAVWLEFDGSPLEPPGSGWRGVGRDVTAKKNLELQLERRATRDERTGLPNRHSLYDRMEADLAWVASGMLAIVHLTHLVRLRSQGISGSSNQMVLRFVRLLQESLGDRFYLARLEYDEFAVWTDDSSLELLERLHAAHRRLRLPLGEGSEAVLVEPRIGLAYFPDDGVDRAGLLRAADLALRSAGADARHSLSRYTEEQSERLLLREALMKELAPALKEGQFFVVYQIQVGAFDGVTLGAEALVRWRHPVRGLISPAEFIPLAEQTGFVTELDEWVLRESCRAAVGWPEGTTVAVNVSGVQLRDPIRLQNAIRTALDQTGLPARRLVVEITESSLLTPGVDAVGVLSTLRDQGIQVALDDFGTGYSSLAYLNDLPLDKLKIDQSFVRNLDRGGNAKNIVEAIIGLAQKFGLATIGEGVETDEQAETLRSLGCDGFQGYLFGRPVEKPFTPT